MKTLNHQLFLLLILLTMPAVGQDVIIKQKSIENKTKFNTVISLMDGDKIKGKLTGCSDSVITISISKQYDYGIFYYDESYYYYDIQYLKIAKKTSARGFFIGAAAGLVYGSIIAATMGVADAVGVPDVSGYANALWIGPLTGAVFGMTIEILAKKRYRFPIESNYSHFSNYRNTIRLMVIDKETLLSH